MRAVFGAALVAVVWLLWLGPGPNAVGQRHPAGAERQPPAGGMSEGLVAAAQASVAVSAKRQLAGEAVVVQERLKERLQKVARTMPEIGMAGQLPADRTETGKGSPEPLQPHIVDPAMIMPAAPPTERGRSAHPADGRTVALLGLPADVVAPEPGQRRTPTWLRNAVASVVDTRPAIAVVIDDLGLNRRGTAALNRVRAPLTLAFLPYATDLDEQTRAARAAGHELLVHVPMEPSSQDWPGPNALTSQLGPAELVSRLRSHLRSFDGFVGVNNHMGSLLTTDPERMAILMAELRQRGLLFLDSRTTSQSVAAREAERSRVPFAERDVFIDNDLELSSVRRALAHAENIARHRGYAVAMGHPHDVTIEALKQWLPTLDARGIALVPISAIVARKSCASGLILVGNACARYAVAQTALP